MLKTLLSIVFSYCLVIGPAVADDATIGYVKTVQGDATVTSAGKTSKAVPGSALLTGDTLRTAKNGSMGVTFKDNTVMSFGPDTELIIDEYLYAPSKGDLKLSASMSKGTLQYVSGIIAKLKPESVTVKTPTGNIGVRGTRFLVKVDEEKK
ncbi:MAG: FecR family protein [Pseudomonadota bacterium]